MNPAQNLPEFLHQPILARLATANPRTLQPHVVPVWFWWDGEAVYISAFESTRKLKDVRRNPRIAVLVEPKELAEGQPQAVLFEGPAELIKDTEEVARLSLIIYTRYMGETGVQAAEPQSWLRDPENTIIRLAPEKIYQW